MNNSPEDLKGIGGWLTFVALGVVVTPLVLAWEYITTLDAEFRASGGSLSWTHLVHNLATVSVPPGESITALWTHYAVLGLIAWSIANVVMFFRHNRKFPVSWVLFMVALIGLTFWGDPAEGTKQVIPSALWCWYMLTSKRVKNTFTRKIQVPAFREELLELPRGGAKDE